MHKHLVGDSDTEIVYRTKSVYTREMRFICFFADVPHLMKTETVKNCLFYSGSGKGTRYMWNNVFFYGHIYHIFIMKIWKMV